MVAHGRKVLIMNELVLDVENYIPMHPGGRFVIEKNLGRDISKFYYGGYSILSDFSISVHVHSRQADVQVYGMIIGHIRDQEKGCQVHEVQIAKKIQHTADTASFKFETVGRDTKFQFRTYYQNLNFIG